MRSAFTMMGALSQRGRRALAEQFPAARLIGRDGGGRDGGGDVGRVSAMSRVPAVKSAGDEGISIFSRYLRSDRLFLVDSDVLFFGVPEVLLERIEDPAYRLNSVNPDVATAYTIPAERGQAFDRAECS